MSDKPPVLAGRAAERIAVVVASPFLALLCYGCYVATHARFGGTSAADWKSRLLDRVFLAMFSEMFVAFLAFLAIAFIGRFFGQLGLLAFLISCVTMLGTPCCFSWPVLLLV